MVKSETAGPSGQPNRPLTDIAYEQLEERIVTLQLPPGSALSEGALVRALGIGRTPVREALQRLAREGLVAILPRRGIVVSGIDAARQLELLLLRREVERLMASLAAERASESERERFRAIAVGMRDAARRNDDVQFMRLDSELNALLAAACRNEYVRRAMALMAGLSRRFWYRHYREVSDLPLCARLHADLADAAGTGGIPAAAAASDRLMDYVERFTSASLEAASDPSTSSG